MVVVGVVTFKRFFYALNILLLLCFLPRCYGFPEPFLCIFSDIKPAWPDLNFPWKEKDHGDGGLISFGASGTFTTLNFWEELNVCAQGVGDLVHARLLMPSEQEHGVAYSYVARYVERKGQRVIFWLDHDARFHNGMPVRPEDVIFSFHFLMQHSKMFSSYFSGIEKVEVMPPTAIQPASAIKLKKKFQGVVFYLKKNAPQEAAFTISELVVLPKSVYEQGIPKIPVGCGPYKVHSYDSGNFILFEKTPHWWGGRHPCQNMYRFQKVKYTYFKDDDGMFEAFKKGDIDIFIENSAKRWVNGYDIRLIHEGKIIKEELPSKSPVPIVGLAFNTRKPILQDIRTRWALNLLFDFETLNRKLFYQYYQRICSFFQGAPCMASGTASLEEENILKKIHAPEETWTQPSEYFTQLPGTWRQRSKAALIFLREAGWKLRNGKLLHDRFGAFQIKVCIPKEMRDEWIQLFKNRAALIGVDIEIFSLDQAAYQATKNTFNYDMIWGFMSISSTFPGQELELIYSSASAQKSGSYNTMGITDPQIDTLIQRIKTAQNQSELQLLTRVLDRYLLAGCYGIFGWYMPALWSAFWKDRIVYPKVSPWIPQRRWIYGWKPQSKNS